MPKGIFPGNVFRSNHLRRVSYWMIYTNEPGIQVYAGNFLDGSLTGKKGITHNQRASVCLETQKYPDTRTNRNGLRLCFARGEKYMSQCIFKFSVDENNLLAPKK